MASSSLLLSPLASATTVENRGLSCNSTGSAFLQNAKLLFAAKPRKSAVRRCVFRSPVAGNHIPKQFREENLKDGLMDNYKNVPRHLYGLTPGQMEMFMNEDNPYNRQAERVTEETISSRYSYLNNGGMYSLYGMSDKEMRSGLSVKMYRGMGASMYRGQGGRYGRRKRSPPDLPSYLLSGRIVYLGMPIVAAVSELIVAQFLYLEYVNRKKPIYLYINSPGTMNLNREIVGAETDAFPIADSICRCRSPVYTINLGIAHGQAAMLLSLGKKGKRALMPHCSTKLYLPSVYKSSGDATDMWIKAKESEMNVKSFLELLAKGTGKPEEELKKDIMLSRFFTPVQAIQYGLADTFVEPEEFENFDKPKHDEWRAKTKAMKEAAAAGGAGAGARADYR